MAKKKAEPAKKMGRPPLEEGSKTERFTFRVTPGWLAWLLKISAAKRKDKAVIAREAFRLWAKHEKVEPPPEE